MQFSNGNAGEFPSLGQLEEMPTGGVSAIARLGEDHGKQVVEDLIVARLASVSGCAVAAHGQERACGWVATQLAVVEVL